MIKFNTDIIKKGATNNGLTTNEDFIKTQASMRALTAKRDRIETIITKLEKKEAEQPLTAGDVERLENNYKKLKSVNDLIGNICTNGVTDETYNALTPSDKILVSLLACVENKQTPIPVIDTKSLHSALKFHLSITDGYELGDAITPEIKQSFSDVRKELTAVLVGIQEKMFDCEYFNPVKLRVNAGVTNKFIGFMRKGLASKEGLIVDAIASERFINTMIKLYIVSLFQAEIVEILEPKKEESAEPKAETKEEPKTRKPRNKSKQDK